LVLAIITLSLLLGQGGTAIAGSLVQRATKQQGKLEKEIRHLRRDRWTRIRILRLEIAVAKRVLSVEPGSGIRQAGDRWKSLRHEATARLKEGKRRLKRWERFSKRRRVRLQTRRNSVAGWLAVWGVFEICPVRGPHYLNNDFGETVRVGKAPPHRHMGNDITAAYWTPIVAPFDGYAWGSSGGYGGNAVRVRGVRGYVYIAHLAAYGNLGYVKTGDVIGYVGSTGLSTAPHAHVEWHPYDGGAVDPYPYLSVSC
jgi:murein DD-endopeptidase MepM/ murein hydrolase activator NlpD